MGAGVKLVGHNPRKLRHNLPMSKRALCLLIVIGFSSCKVGERHTLPTQPITADSNAELGMSKFRVIGPFPLANDQLPASKDTPTVFGAVGKPATGLTVDYLANYFGVNEAGLTEPAVRTLSSPDRALPAGFVNQEVQTIYGPMHDPLYLDLRELFRTSGYIAPAAPAGNTARESPTDFATAYAVCQILSPKAQEVVLLLGVDNAAKVWINNALAFESSDLAPTASDERLHMAVVNFRKGPNLVVAKAYNVHSGWALTLRFMGTERVRKLLQTNAEGRILTRRVLIHGQPAILTALAQALYPASSHPRLQFSDSAGRIAFSTGSEASSAPFWQCVPGIYRATLISDSGTADEQVYCGPDPNLMLRRYQSRAERVRKTKDVISINTQAIIHRLTHLLKPENRKDEDPGWQSKIVYTVSECEQVIGDMERRKPAFRDVIGRHLRGYRSRIDGQVQHYMVYAPKNYSRTHRPIPLVVRVPYPTLPSRPFLESWHVADSDIIGLFQTLADQYGFAVLWANGRNARSTTSVGFPVGTTDIFEAIAAVQADYSIDDDRIYLTGDCQGGLEALGLAMRFPGRFAASGLTSPFFTRVEPGRERTSFNASDVVQSAASAWDDANSPMNLVENIRNLPVAIFHEKQHKHSPLAPSLEFVKRAAAAGIEVPLEVIDYESGTVCPIRSPLAKCFEFFKGKSRQQRPQVVTLRTAELKYGVAYWLRLLEKDTSGEMAMIRGETRGGNRVSMTSSNVNRFEILLPPLGYRPGTELSVVLNGNEVFRGIPTGGALQLPAQSGETSTAELRKTPGHEGPIVDAFGDGFLVVEGTIGSGAERRQITKLARDLCANWKKAYFVDCPLKTDREITGSDIEEKNLVLFGTADTNAVVSRIAHRLPLSASSEGVCIAGRDFPGRNVGYALVYPNPLNPRRYVVVVGGNRPRSLVCPISYPWMDAIADYFVWNGESSSAAIILGAGHFDGSWRNTIP